MRIVLILLICVTSSAAICLPLLDEKAIAFGIMFPNRIRKWNRKTRDFDLIDVMNRNTSMCSVHRDDDLTNKTLVVSGVMMLPYLARDGDRLTGYLGDIWTILENELNFRTVYQKPTTLQYDMWSGEIQYLLTAVPQNFYSNGHFDYSPQIAENHYGLFMLSQDSRVSKWWYVSIFSHGLWATSGLFVVGITGLIFGMYKVKRAICRNYVECNNELAISSFNFISVLGVMTGQGFQKIPTSWSLRCLIISAVIMGMLISCGFSSTLTSYLAIRDSSLPFYSLGDVVDKRTHSVCVRINSTGHDHLKKLAKIDANKGNNWLYLINKNCPNMSDKAEFIAKMCRPGYVYVETPDILLETYQPHEHVCTLVRIPGEYWSIRLSFLQSRKAPHRHIINKYIARLRSAGVLKKLEKRWISKGWPSANKHQWVVQPVEYAHIQLILIVLLAMMFFSGIICVFENVWHQFTLRREINNRARIRREHMKNMVTTSFEFPAAPIDSTFRRIWTSHVKN